MEENKNENVKGNAIASLVCGIVGFFFAGIILGIISIIQGSKTLEVAKEGEPYYKMAKAGKILGIVDIIGGVVASAITIFGA